MSMNESVDRLRWAEWYEAHVVRCMAVALAVGEILTTSADRAGTGPATVSRNISLEAKK